MLRLLLLVLLLAPVALAQDPRVDSVVNAASYTPSALPGGGLGQGSMVIIFGVNLGPGQILIVSAFPLPLEMGGTSARITMGATTVRAIMIYTLASQVAIIIPSNTPLGNGTLVLTYNGRNSAAFPVRIVRATFGIFALNQAGSGQGIFTDPDFRVNSLVLAARPTTVWIAWGTGMGAVAGDEAGGVLPGDMVNANVVVIAGGKRARIIYRGRSGCCAGIDQIAFEVPEGIEGCYVPVVVLVNDVPSNYVTMSVASQGTVCADSTGFNSTDLTGAQSRGSLRVGTISLDRSSFSITIPMVGTLDSKTDTGSASFLQYDASNLLAARQFAGNITLGACIVFTFSGTAQVDPIRPVFLDAGRIMVTGPRGTKELTRVSTGVYSETLGGGTPSIPGVPGPAPAPDFLEPGNYRITGSGATVGSFEVNLGIGAPLNWTNRDSINSVPLSQPLTVAWTGGDAARDTVQIFGTSSLSSARVVAGFICQERVGAGRFTIPVEVLAALPASEVDSGVPTGTLIVGTFGNTVRFQASGLDAGFALHMSSSGKLVNYTR